MRPGPKHWRPANGSLDPQGEGIRRSADRRAARQHSAVQEAAEEAAYAAEAEWQAFVTGLDESAARRREAQSGN